MKQEYSQTQFLGNISKLDNHNIFAEIKDVLKLIEFVIEEHEINDDVMNSLDMNTIEEALTMIHEFEPDKPYAKGNEVNPLNEMMTVYTAKSVLLNIKTQRITSDRDFF